MRILIVEDEENLCWFLRESLAAAGHEADFVHDGEAALERVREYSPDAMVLDINLPGMDGLEVLKHVAVDYPETAVVMLTAYDSARLAVKALKGGASDYLTKPFKVDELLAVLERALDSKKRSAELACYRREAASRVGGGKGDLGIVGCSEAIAAVREMILKVAGTDATVLVTGESGTGKELVARAVHFAGSRAEGPFMAVNCSALPDTLLESELFGYERGAFTGASRQRRGYFELAGGGSIFLDEIGDMSASAQSKVLRVLQEHKIVRLGGGRNIDVDVRVICATNRDLEALVREGRFREDLYYRVNVLRIHLPPLRERMEDVMVLASHFLAVFCKKYDRRIAGFDEQAQRLMTSYGWPGNVRELQNMVERAVLLCPGDVVTAAELALPAAGKGRLSAAPVQLDGRYIAVDDEPPLEELEKRYITALMEKYGSRRKVASILGVDPKTVYRKLKKYEEEEGKCDR